MDHYTVRHIPKEKAYPAILHIMAGLLVAGFVANLLVQAVAAKYWVKTAPAVTV